MNKKGIYQGTGRRKTSVARVRLAPGSGKITINNCDVLNFFPYKTLVQDLEQPLMVTDTKKDYDVLIKVSGGGFSGQAGAARLGIARALLEVSEDFRLPLRQFRLLTRDSRKVERKKYGRKKARKLSQFSKR